MNRVTDSTAIKNVYLLIPAYKAAASLGIIIPKLIDAGYPPNTICIVDDGSNDGTEGICTHYETIYLRHEKNGGKGAALKTGFNYLLQKKAQWIVTMDADLQHSIDDIPTFLEGIENYPEAGMIIGTRAKTLKTMPPARIFSNVTTSAIMSLLCKQKIEDSQCGFRVYNGALLGMLSIKFDKFEMESEVILRACHAGFKIRFVPIQTLYGDEKSHISHIKDMIRWIHAVTDVWYELRRLKIPEAQ